MLPVAAALALIFSPSQPSIALHPPTPDADETHPTATGTARGVVVAWVERRPSRAEVKYVFSQDTTIFSAPISVSGPTGGTETIRPHAASFGERAVITWADASRGDHDVYAAISDDGGRIFAPPILVAGGEGGQLDPRAVVLQDESIAIVFHDSFGSTGGDRGVVRRIRIATAARNTGGFGPARAIGSVDPALAFDLFPTIDGTSTVAVSWLREHHDGTSEIMLARSSDGGATFSPEQAIDSPLHRELRAHAAWSTASQLVFYEALLPAEGPEAVYLDVLSARIGADAEVFNVTRALHQSRLEVSTRGERVSVAWIDHSAPGVRRIVLRESYDGGLGFGPERGLESGDVDHPALAIGAERTTIVVYEDGRGGSWDVRATVLP